MLFLLACHSEVSESVAPVGRSTRCADPVESVHYEEVSQEWGLVDTTSALPVLDSTYGPVGMADLDEDGDDDLVIGLLAGGFEIHWNEGDHFKPILVLNGLHGSAIAIADVDGDRHLDLLLAGVYNDKLNVVYLLKGDGHRNFTEPERDSIPMRMGDIRTMDLADVDRDGDLDLYITNSNIDVYALNEGDGRFVEHTSELALTTPRYPWLGLWLDLDRDQWTDLFVDTDLKERGAVSDLYHNEGGILSRIPSFNSVNAMGGTGFDYNNDGYPDVFLTSTGGDGLYQNMGDRSFVDVSLATAAKGRNVIGQMSMGSMAVDYDNDGWMDLATSAGRYAGESSVWLCLDPFEPDQMLHNEQGVFRDVSETIGFGSDADSHALTWGMLDGDGTPDLVVSDLGVSSKLYRSVCGANRSLEVDLIGHASNSYGIGARVEVETEDGTLSRWNTVMAGLGASQPPRVHVGLGTGKVEGLTVYWPSGTIQKVEVDPYVEGRLTVEEE